jgi:hypothetical protein
MTAGQPAQHRRRAAPARPCAAPQSHSASHSSSSSNSEVNHVHYRRRGAGPLKHVPVLLHRAALREAVKQQQQQQQQDQAIIICK